VCSLNTSKNKNNFSVEEKTLIAVRWPMTAGQFSSSRNKSDFREKSLSWDTRSLVLVLTVGVSPDLIDNGEQLDGGVVCDNGCLLDLRDGNVRCGTPLTA
jgi:hypothetical protein